MPNLCKHQCVKYDTRGIARYSKGDKWCRVCGVAFRYYYEIRCPCCSAVMRTGRRQNEEYIQRQKIRHRPPVFKDHPEIKPPRPTFIEREYVKLWRYIQRVNA